MSQSISEGVDSHPDSDPERRQTSWAVAIADDCEECGPGEIRVVLTLEEMGMNARGVSAHLSPDDARRLRAGLGSALKAVGEETASG